MNLDYLPIVNVVCNFNATLLLLAGRYAIYKNYPRIHRVCMLLALFWSTVFLTSYLYYHYQVGHKVYPYLGWRKTLYQLILFPHIMLAAIVLPLIFRTLYLAIKKRPKDHEKWARWTFPIWLYVSFSGILIFIMLYT